MRRATIDQIGKLNGFEPNDKMHWSVGQKAAALYTARNGGVGPPHDYAPKTKATQPGAAHFKNYYPESFWPEIARLMREYGADDASQGDLF